MNLVTNLAAIVSDQANLSAILLIQSCTKLEEFLLRERIRLNHALLPPYLPNAKCVQLEIILFFLSQGFNIKLDQHVKF